MALGLIGAVVPVLPGAVLVFAGAVVWAWADGFDRVGWPTLVILGVLAVIALGSDLIATTVTGRKAGIGWRTIGAAIAGGIAGGILGSALPVLGTLLGAILGSLLGVLLMEHYRTGDWQQAWQATKAYAIGFLIGRALEVVLCLVMIGVFLVGVWR